MYFFWLPRVSGAELSWEVRTLRWGLDNDSRREEVFLNKCFVSFLILMDVVDEIFLGICRIRKKNCI